MGLDMYLDGDVYFYELSEDERKTTPVQQTYRLGQWRSRHHLHDYLVDEFADGELSHQELEMGEAEVRQVLTAINANPSRDMCPIFSSNTDDKLLKMKTIEALEYAIEWMKAEQPGTWRSVWYRASW